MPHMKSTSVKVSPAAEDVVDREHQVQLGLIESLLHGIQAEQAAETLDELQENLDDFTRVHFLSEELLMRLHAYPDYQAHVAEHVTLLDALEAFANARRDGRMEDAIAAVEALRSMIVEHIAEQDARLAAYFKSSGVGPASG